MIDTSAAPGRSTSRLPASGLSTTSGRPTYRRILRRETHSPRSTLAIVLAIVVIVACAWFGAEIVLATLGHPALLVSPRQLAAAVVSAPSYTASIVVATGVAASVVGIVLVVASLSPGRLARHSLDSEHSAAVVDNEVIASALARHAARTGNVDPDSVTVSVSHRTAVVRVTPTSGVLLDRSAISAAVDEQLTSYRMHPVISSRVIVTSHGKVGT